MSSWAKMADDLDRNRKIRKGGRNAREVFLWVLRKVASNNTSGWVKAEDFDDLEYLADELMAPVTDVTDGVTRCFEVGLLVRDCEKVCVAGWDGQWEIRKPLSNSERQKRHRDAKKTGTSLAVTKPPVTNSRYEVTDAVTSNESNVGEERRGEREQTRARGVPIGPDPEALPAQAAAATQLDLSRRLGVLAKSLWAEHCDRYDAVKPPGMPALVRHDTANGFTSLRERLRVYGGDLVKAEADCRHVLDVLEAEAVANIKKGTDNPVQWFGERAWSSNVFAGALSKSPPKLTRLHHHAGPVHVHNFFRDGEL